MTLYVTHSLPWLLFTGSHRPVYRPGETRCPECGGRLLVEISGTRGGVPTANGVEVYCEDEGGTAHRYFRRDWCSITNETIWWAQSHLRKVDSCAG